MRESTCAILVTFNPTEADLSGLACIRKQVDHLCVVDNGSCAEVAAELREAAVRLRFRLIQNGCNRGIASGLNIGVQVARSWGCAWAFLFDQDSQIPEHYVKRMLTAFRGHPQRHRLAILVPRYLDVHLGSELSCHRAKDEGLLVAMTSGSLMPLGIFEEVGGFEECLFIDGVDYEFCLRVKRKGFLIDQAEDVVLTHAPAQKQRHVLLGAIPFISGHCAPVRHYYQMRNAIWIARRHGAVFPTFCLMQIWTLTKNIVKVLLAEQEKATKLRLWSQGVWDGLAARMGSKALR